MVKWGLLALLPGCSLITDSFVTNDFSGDQYPIDVETSSGAIIVGLAQQARPDRDAVLDVLSPITIVDQGPSVFSSLSVVDLTLLGENGPGGALEQPRARFPEAQLVTLHPCDDPACSVGPGNAPRPFDAVLGADTLAGDALRLRLGDSRMFILADIAGDDHHRAIACDTVFDSPYRGGGTLVIAGTELPFGNRRITLQSCLGPKPAETQQDRRGTDALLVMSTSIGISILSETAYTRYAEGHPGVPTLAQLTTADSVFLPSGLVTGKRAMIDGMALVGATANGLAPCREVYAHHVLTPGDCITDQSSPDFTQDCPCENNNAFCQVPAVLELQPPAGLDVLVVPDDNSTLQALRTELRPDQPEVDGLLGTNAITAAEIDIDYPHDRIVARCAQANCVARPQLATSADRTQVQNCLGVTPRVSSR